MDLVKNLFVLLHLLGMAAIVGSWLFVIRGAAHPALVWGARAQLLTGLLLVGLVQANDRAGQPHQDRRQAARGRGGRGLRRDRQGGRSAARANPTLVNAAGALAVLNAAIAALW